MNIRTKTRELLIDLTGYWIYRRKEIPVGCDLINDLKHKIRLPLKTIFDVGANIGQTALRYNDYFKKAEIYSFEPVTETFHNLEKNVKCLNRIKCFKLALGDKEGSAEIKIATKEDSRILIHLLGTL